MDEFETETHEHAPDVDGDERIEHESDAWETSGRRPRRMTAPDADVERWRVGTTGLPAKDADRVWQWYTAARETAVVNDNRSRGVRASLERAVLFPRRAASESDHEGAALPEAWIEWAIRRGVSREDVQRNDLLIARQATEDVPRPVVPPKRE